MMLNFIFKIFIWYIFIEPFWGKQINTFLYSHIIQPYYPNEYLSKYLLHWIVLGIIYLTIFFKVKNFIEITIYNIKEENRQKRMKKLNIELKKVKEEKLKEEIKRIKNERFFDEK